MMTRPVRFCDVTVGMTLDEMQQDFTQESIDKYAVASLDLNPVHIDPEWASRAKVFGQPKTVGHGMATMSLMVSVITRSWGPTAKIIRIKSKFTKPVWVDQKITAKGSVRDLHYLEPDRKFARVYVEATNSDGEMVGFSEIDVNLAG